MADAVEVKFDEKRLAEIQRLLRDIPKAMPKVMSRGINRTTKSSRAEIVKKIAAEVTLKQKTIKKSIRVEQATYTRWQARIGLGQPAQGIAAGKHLGRKEGRIPLISFKARQRKKGRRKLTYQVSKTGGRQTFTEKPLPFITTMNTFKGVFRRVGKERWPVEHFYGPSIGGVFEGAAGIAAEVQESTGWKLEKNIDQQIAFILSRRKTG
jgi:hypothetical protein